MGETGDLALQYYRVRLETFEKLNKNENQASDTDRPNFSVSDRTSFIKLARAGFYYDVSAGAIQCFICEARYLNWHNESPVAVHRILNPYCRFLQSSPASCSSENNICCNSSTTQSPATDGLASNHCCTNSQQPDNPGQLRELLGLEDRFQMAMFNSSLSPHPYPLHRRNYVADICNMMISSKANTTTGCRVLLSNIRRVTVQNAYAASLWSDHVEEYAGRITHPIIGNVVLSHFESFRTLTYPNPQDETAGEWAADGFLYIVDDKVQCVYCAGVVMSYREQLNIIDVHEKISPKGRYCCPMVSGIDVGNVSRKLEELVRKKLTMTDQNNRLKTRLSVLHPQYRSMEERLASFIHWSKQYKPTKTQLTEAGFFYTGVATKVLCFCCGLSIRDWEPTADPWQQHALLSPTCGFVKFEKGEEFIQEMASIQQLVQVDPSVTEPVTSIGELNIPDPYPPTLSTTQLAAYSTCGRYPSVDMLKAAVLAGGELKKKDDMLDLKDEQIQTKDKQLDNVDHVMSVKDQFYKATVASLNQHHNIIIDCKEQELIHKDQELNQVSQERNQVSQERNQFSQELNQVSQQLNQMSQHYRCTKRRLRQQIREKDDHIENLSNRLQTAVDKHRSREDNLQQNLQQQMYIHQTQLQRKQTELETETAQLQAEIQKYEEEMSNLVTEFTRIKSTVNKQENQQENKHDSAAVNQPEPSAINPDRCLICSSETRVVLFQPCKHVCCCANCAPRFKDSPCPVCRRHVQNWEIIFLP